MAVRPLVRLLVPAHVPRNRVPAPGRALMIWGGMGVTMVFFLAWTVFPLGYAFLRSFYDWQPLLGRHVYVGLRNYHEAIAIDPLFFAALRNTAHFALLNVAVGSALCLLVALAINVTGRGNTFYRISFFLPVVCSEVGTALIWRFMYQPRFGIINTALFTVARALGVTNPPEIGWLTDPSWAMNSVVIYSLWKYLGFRMIILLAGLQAIPDVYYEAAQLDGAGRWSCLRHIILPLLLPTLSFVLIIGVINSLQVFSQIYVMTAGGPGNATLSVVMLLYRAAFQMLRFGYASAISFILFGIILVLTAIQLKVLRPSWEY